MIKGAKRSSTSDPPLDDEKRLKIVSALALTRGVSKTGLATTLKILQEQGLLKDSLVSTPAQWNYIRQVRSAVEHLALHTFTPYGALFRDLPLPIDEAGKPYELPYTSPLALLHHLCSVNLALFTLVKNAVAKCSGKLRIVIYIDEINPGNPLAPDPQKLVQAIYWCLLELPTWFNRRKDGWFCFSLMLIDSHPTAG